MSTRGVARQGKAWQGKAWQGGARRGGAWPGMAGHGRAGQIRMNTTNDLRQCLSQYQKAAVAIEAKIPPHLREEAQHFMRKSPVLTVWWILAETYPEEFWVQQRLACAVMERSLRKQIEQIERALRQPATAIEGREC